jgi:glycosyltransferase involved in cell wall biosynthesis
LTAIRVAHVPGRTPYARKLHDERIQILNGTAVGGVTVPYDLTLSWLLDHRPWTWLDVIHLHHPDFEPISRLRTVLAECRRAGTRIVFTAHDVTPVFGGRAAHHRRLCVLAGHDVPFVCLTPTADSDVRRRFAVRTSIAPHGYVAAPATRPRRTRRAPGHTRFLIYGSLRQNRDVGLVLACWRFARLLAESTLHLLLRAPSRASLAEDAEVWQAIREHAADPRLLVDVLPFPNDDEINQALAKADCLLLPYRWASHSGQLEHALDLGVLPVAARTGYLPDQVALHNGLAAKPLWFDWSDGAPFEQGARLLTAMQAADTAIQDGWQPPDTVLFGEHRRREHSQVMAAYRALYEGTR